MQQGDRPPQILVSEEAQDWFDHLPSRGKTDFLAFLYLLVERGDGVRSLSEYRGPTPATATGKLPSDVREVTVRIADASHGVFYQIMPAIRTYLVLFAYPMVGGVPVRRTLGSIWKIYDKCADDLSGTGDAGS